MKQTYLKAKERLQAYLNYFYCKPFGTGIKFPSQPAELRTQITKITGFTIFQASKNMHSPRRKFQQECKDSP
jgi:hypothetical protein